MVQRAWKTDCRPLTLVYLLTMDHQHDKHKTLVSSDLMIVLSDWRRVPFADENDEALFSFRFLFLREIHFV